MYFRGFSLLEVVMLLGVLGLLVALAAPNFSKYQARSRQSEAKLSLASIYAGERSFFSEYKSYVSSFDAIGYVPEGTSRNYWVGWRGPHSYSIPKYAGPMGRHYFPSEGNPFQCAETPSELSLATPLRGVSQRFEVVAVGCIRESASVLDRWKINEAKELVNFESGF